MKKMTDTIKNLYHIYAKNNVGRSPDTIFLPYWAYEQLLVESTGNYPIIDVMNNKVLGMAMVVYVKGFTLDTIFLMHLAPCYESKAMQVLDRSEYPK